LRPHHGGSATPRRIAIDAAARLLSEAVRPDRHSSQFPPAHSPPRAGPPPTRVQQKVRIEKAGLDEQTLERLTARTRIDTRNIKEEEPQKGCTNPLRAFMALMLVCFTIILYGTAIMNSVLEDKQTRIAEVMLAKVNARQFLLGKIIGVGLAGVLQYSIWVGLYVGAAKIWPSLASSAFSIPLRSLPIIVASFAVGYISYATLYAVVGAITENSQDAAQLQWPVLIFLILPLVTVWGVLREPDAPFAMFMTWFPMTLPLMLPARMVIGPVPDWQLWAVYSFAFLFAFVVVWLAGRLFRAVILMYGKKPSMREFIRKMLASDAEPMTTAAHASEPNGGA
jgi:ABC-2 type transport system permease protein